MTYEGLCGVMSIALPIVLLAYYPLSRFIAWWLPAYDSAVLYLGILLPICVFDGKNSMVYTTFLKVRRGESALLGANCAALIISAVLSALFSLVFRSIKGVVFSLFIAVAIRNVFLTYACNKSMNVVHGPTWAVELGLASCFALANTLFTWPVALFSVLFTSLIYCVVQRRQVEVVMGWLSAVLAERK